MEVIRAYPEFRELYQEVFRFRYQKKEILELKGDLEMERKASSEKDKEIERLHALLDAQKNI